MSPLEVLWLRRIRQQLCASLRGRGLDIGAGSGANFPFLEPHLEVTAIEPEEWMRERAEQRLKPHIQLRAGVAESLPFEDGSLDWALCTLVLCSVQQPERSLQELRRVLKPQGELLFLEHVRGQGWKGRLHDWCTPWWSWLVHGCHLNRATGDALQRQFVVEDIEHLEIASVPFVFGRARPR